MPVKSHTNHRIDRIMMKDNKLNKKRICHNREYLWPTKNARKVKYFPLRNTHKISSTYF